MASSPGEGAGALEKALDVLDAIGAAPEGLSQSHLADRLGLPRTTIYRLLATLVARGLLRRDPLRKVYGLGFRCIEMAHQAYAMPDLGAAAALELRALRDLTGETTYLATLDRGEVMSLERCDGLSGQRLAALLAERNPLHSSSQGKAILSAMDEGERQALLQGLTLKAHTRRTLTERRRLEADLRASRTRGYAIDDEETVIGVRCVGAPVVDSAGRVRGAISIAGPAFRLTHARLELLAPEVVEAARRVGAQLYVPGEDAAIAAQSAITALPGPWAFHGAYPVWSADGARLWWADALAPSVRLWDGNEDRLLAMLEAPVVGLLQRSDGTLLAVHEHGAVIVGADGATSPLAHWPGAPVLAVCNGTEGEGGAADAVWAAVGLTAGGAAVGPVRADGELDIAWRIGEPVRALRWHAVQGRLYATAPDAGAILVMEPGTEAVRRFAVVPADAGRTGGLAFDLDGGVWTAFQNGGAVARFDADGQLDRVIRLPVPCVTDLAFGGARGERLVVTTARHEVAPGGLAAAPLSGRLLTFTV